MKKVFILIFSTLLILVLSIYLYARYIGTSGLVVKEYKVEANISDNFDGLKVIQFSDLDYNTTINKKDLDYILKKINFINPDIVIFTGDLIYSKTSINDNLKNELINFLSNIKVTLGKYAINGEMDNDLSSDILNKGGFKILNNNYELIYKNDLKPILIAGTSSSIKDKTDINEKLNTTYSYIVDKEIEYKILLMHEPDTAGKVSGFNLILAGHSHNGQIILPFVGRLMSFEDAKKYYDAYYEVNGTRLYVSSGLGTTKYKLRLNNRPSINFYRIVKG